ncbi:MAG: SDR family NAD(P)-dependent oxidoreductase, partial [Promethearchaeota archaeon]
NMKTVAIILAGGIGNRFKLEIPKQFVKLSGKLVIEHTIDKFENHPLIDIIYISVHSEWYNLMEDIIKRNAYKKVKKLLIGGATRQESSKIGCFACEHDIDKVLIHDAVRPFVSEKTISKVILALDKFPAVDVAIPSTDTIIEVSDEKRIKAIPPRKYLMRGQTPQGFWLSVIKKAHIQAEKDDYNSAVDDCSLILKYDLGSIHVVDDSEYNMKITYPIDIHIADKIFQIYKVELANLDFETLKKGLNNKVVVVFGGTSGIGLEICKMCKEFGGYAYGFSRRNGVDIRNFEDIKKTLRDIYKIHNKIDSIICSSGILRMSFIETVEILDIMEQININLIGNMLVGKASISYLKETKGSLIFFASSSYTRGREGYTPYSASKAALVNFVQGFAEEVSHYGIKVNVISPERTDTPLRRKNFGKEDKTLLLNPKFVALQTLRTICSDLTSSVIDVRKITETDV